MRTNEYEVHANPEFLSGGEEMGRLIRSIDWEQTALGQIHTWPQSLRTTLSIILNSKFPMLLFWGEEHICLYNDAYRLSWSYEGKHPFALGKKAAEVWPEIWDSVKPLLDQVSSGGEAIFKDGQLAYLFLDGKIEDTSATFSYSPVIGETGKPAGVLATCYETTAKIETFRKLQQLTQYYRSMADTAPVMIWITDDKGYCTYLNKQWLDFTAQTLEEGQGLGWVNAVHPDDQEETARQFIENSRNQQAYEKEYRLRKWDGSYEWVLDSAIPRLDEEGSFLGYIGSVVNIHQRKLAEQELQETSRRLQIATTAAQVAIWSLDVKTNKLDWTSLHKKMWGYDERSTDLTYEDWYKVILPGDREKAFENVEKAKRQHTQYDASYRIKRANDGVIRWMRSFGQYFYNDKGEPETLTGVSIDITEQKLVEERILESEERFRTLADQAPMWVWMSNEKMQNTYSNKELLRFIGLSHFSELAAHGWQAYVHPKDIQMANEALDKASKEQRPVTVEFRVKNAATGRYEWFLNKAVPLYENNIFKGFIGTAINIQQQKKQLEALMESELRFRTLAETQPHLVWMTDDKGIQLYVSSRWKEFAGFKPTGMESWLQIIHPDDLPDTGKAWTHSLQTGDIYRVEARLKNKTGEYRWHSGHGEAVRNEKGKITRWIGAFADIHDQKTLSQKLEEQVRKRTRELQRSNEDLQQFAHVASHDLKEPVRKIKTFVTRLQEEIGEQLHESGKMYINRVLNAANRMVVMIDGVLTYSTISAVEEMFEPVDLNEVLKSVEVDLELVIQQKEATIRYSDLPILEGAPILLHQLFYNLVNNALKFTKPGVPPVITISAQIEDNNSQEQAQIVVQDNGIGFEQEYADQIFGTFTRLHSKDKYEGSGLGLALCKNIVERHGGTIQAKGKPNEGAAFIITLLAKR